ncbi:16S rRNA (cytosine(967)-C(5))-methyltransferase RsmB [Bombilactobacillus thymidiniphilus]|uniref:16S rRNA (cytosine(967)-C(5))-methyltransferase n=1 Tax=Bombilactobacillus thymidiniphilus TaxID=2923363 RepID=A0ABY4PCI1_9LACO|nr:16S rRNA (cytosine(967)-C(5))-methyltransferase RsmB [Bombilactobacillus thymidiniphilus]UQS83458.1 16S rRNA (cytosine(967)-C(5))-methyltransferase RsmB [Bombilactobacillus thymidiniphilus]
MAKERIFKLAITSSTNNNPRYWATKILTQVTKGAGYSNLLINQTVHEQQFSDKDQRLMVQLVYGVLQHKLTLDYYLEPYLKGKQIAEWVQNLLRVAVYQMVYLDKIPAHAIFYEATQIAKELGNIGLSKLVTAVLRNLQRHKWRSFSTLAPKTRLSIEYSIPYWIVEQLEQQVGLVKTESILKSLNQPPKTSIRVNTAKIAVDELQQELDKDDLSTTQSQLTPEGLVGEHGFAAGTQWFQAGFCTVQDESSMLVAPALQLQSDSRVLDACAAPGGKTTQIASYLGSEGQVIALDLHAKKVKLIEQNAKRLGLLEKIQAKALDARQVGNEFEAASFDRILVDAPCSGFGLMRRKPEIRYERDLFDCQNLSKIQSDILEAVAPLLKVNGLLVYSTCTIFDVENQQVITKFLAKHPDFQLVPVKTMNDLPSIKRDGFIKIYPDDYQTDGFFIACLKKVR